MPTITYKTKNETEGWFKKTLLSTKVTIKYDGTSVASAHIQYIGRDSNNPNLENYATQPGGDKIMANRGIAAALTYAMLQHVDKTKFDAVTIKSAHGGVIGLSKLGFTMLVSGQHVKNKKLEQCDLVCTDIPAALTALKAYLEGRYDDLVLP
jgi:hypothetical protein